MKHLLTVVLFAFCAVHATHGSAAPKSPKASKSERTWEPSQYDESTLRLAPGYQGVDPKRFYETFSSRTEALKKGEFETSEEFSQRTSDADTVLAPISTKRVYAFRIQGIEPKYNADRQVYEFFGLAGDYSCDPAGLTGGDRGMLTCKVANVMMLRDKYTGSNAYGASRVVERTRATHLALALPNTPRIFSVPKDSGSVFDYPDSSGSVRLVDTLEMSIDRAKAIKGTIGVLFVGNVTGTSLVDGKATLVEPKIDNPTDIFITTAALPFNLRKIVYYVIPTGEILAQRSFD